MRAVSLLLLSVVCAPDSDAVAADTANHYHDPGHGVRKHYGLCTGRYTLANFYPVIEWELFDLEKDLLQLRSVCDDPAYAKTLAELNAELNRLRTLYKDTDEAEAAKPERRRARPAQNDNRFSNQRSISPP